MIRLFRPMPLRFFLGSVCACLLLRLSLAFEPGYEADLRYFKTWTLAGPLAPISQIYEITGADYPPASLYMWHTLGRLYYGSSPPTADSPEALVDSVPTPLVKFPAVVLDLLLAGVLYWLVARVGLWGRERDGPGWGRLCATFYLWNPAVLFGNGYWGNPDSLHCLVALVSLGLLGAGSSWGSASALSFASLAKPQPAPLVPMLALAVALRDGWRGVLAAGIGGVATAALLFAPFIVTGRFSQTIERVVGDIDILPYTSLNAHNLWWILGAWKPADAPLLGPISATQLGLGIFFALYIALGVRSVGWMRPPQSPEYRARLFVLAAAVIANFFFFSTHMHENGLVLALPLLLAVAGRSAPLAWLAAGCSLAIVANEVLHDPSIPFGLPFGLSSPSPVQNTAARYLGLESGSYTWLQLIGSYLNSALVGVVAAGSAAVAWRQGARAELTGDAPPPVSTDRPEDA